MDLCLVLAPDIAVGPSRTSPENVTVNDAPAAIVHSLRDPDGKLVTLGGRLFRIVSGSAAAARLALTERPALRAAMERGAIARTWQAADVPAELAALRPDANATVLEHELLPFVSYPCEWSPLMLCDAALRTLEMQQLALAEGLILKDAAPTNIVFRGSRPVFVDFLSFIEREPGEYLWRARHQFDACFLLPLLLNIEAGIPVAWTLRDFHPWSRARAGATHPGHQVLAQAGIDRRNRLARHAVARRLVHGRDPCDPAQT